MSRIGVERLCVFGMPPVEFVRLAAQLDCRFVGIGLTPMRAFNPHDYPDWSLKDDAALRREMRAACTDCNVNISLCEGFAVTPRSDVSACSRDLDSVCELGGQRINVVSTDRDLARTFDQFTKLVEMAATRGIETVTEVGMGPIANLTSALAALRHAGHRGFSLLIDTMHYFRLGGSIAGIEALEPGMIGYVQLCDAPLQPRFATYMEEALYERMVPGEGALPLLEFLSLISPDVIVSVEVPQRSLAQAGLGPLERVGSCVAAARNLIAHAHRRVER